MLKNLIKQNRGFSLMELIVTLAIVSILSVGLLTVLSTTQRASNSIDKAMSCQQQTESVISIIRASLANASDVSVIDIKKDYKIPDDISEKKGDIMTRPDGVKYIDDYCYIIADKESGGIIVIDFDDSDKRVIQRYGDVKRLDMYDSVRTQVHFGLTDGQYIDVVANSVIVTEDKDAGTSKETQTQYGLQTQIATDENVCEAGATKTVAVDTSDPAYADKFRCIRFRRVDVTNYTWASVPGAGDGGADLDVGVGQQKISVSNDLTLNKGALLIVNTTNELYTWPAKEIKFGGKEVVSFTCSDANFFISIDKKSVTLSPKSPVSRSDDIQTISFSYELQEPVGIQAQDEPVDNGDGTGYIRVVNTTNESFNWNATLTFSRALESFTITPGDSQTIITSDFDPSANMSTVHIIGITEKGDGPVEMRFEYVKKETDDNFVAHFVATNTETGTYEGKEGTFTDGFVVIENPNETKKKKTWECEVTSIVSGSVVVYEETYSNCTVIDGTDPQHLVGSDIELEGLEKTVEVEDTSKKYVKVRYFKELEEKPTVEQILVAAAYNDLTVGGVKGGEWRCAFRVKNPHPTKYLRNVRVRVTTPNGKMIEDTLCDNKDSNGFDYKLDDGSPATNIDAAVPPLSTLGAGNNKPYDNGNAAFIHYAHNAWGQTKKYNEHKDMPCPTILKNDINGKLFSIQVIDYEYFTP